MRPVRGVMCSFIFTNKPVTEQDLHEANSLSKYRGPDSTDVLTVGNISGLHNLLSITGETTHQPFYENDVIGVFNGQIYNYKQFGDYKSDAKCIVDLYLEYGCNFVRELDGEFAITLYDFVNDKLIIASDSFRTKPLHMAFCGDYFGVSTYASSLYKLGFSGVSVFPANKVLEKSGTRSVCYETFVFDLNQHKLSYDDWIDAYENSIRKRTSSTREKIFTGLSSGHDSGGIFCEMKKQNVDFKSYSVMDNECDETINQRISNHSKSSKIKFDRSKSILHKGLIETSVEEYRAGRYNIKTDLASVALSYICKQATRDECKIYISGAGADEIMSDYCHSGTPIFKENSCFGGIFPESLTSMFPWENFYEGTQQNYLMKEEHICGRHGIEARYPYLDRQVVQEFLWLSANLKNKAYNKSFL